MPSDLTVACIEQRTELAKLEEEWDKLLDQSDVASPFLTSGWQMAWLDTYGTAYRPFVLVAREAAYLVGLWPLARRWRGPFRVLEPIGAGRSDWLDILVRKDRREAVLSAFLGYLAGHRSVWDVVELRDMLVDSPSIQTLEMLVFGGPLRLRRRARTGAPYLAISGSWESYLASRSSNFRSTLRRRLKAAGGAKDGLEVKVITSPDPVQIVEILADVERKSWKAQEGNRKLTTQIGREFYRRFIGAFAALGLLRIWVASAHGTVVAYLVLFVHKGKCYYYNGAYAEDASNLSPGTVLHAAAIAEAFRMELREYDFLSGDELFKGRWSTGRREIHHLVIFNRRLVSLVAFSVLVSLRWAFRRSKILREGRVGLLLMVRRFIRRRGLQ
jgi:CelD/BcsL family acetyltransferase involved in cellulose biosynthesis